MGRPENKAVKMRILKESCPFCFSPILIGQDTTETFQGLSHLMCPAEAFLRKFKRVGLIRGEATRRLNLCKIMLFVDLRIKIFNVKLARRLLREKFITQEEAEGIDRQMEVLIWASRMFLGKDLTIARSENTGLREMVKSF